ncbi:MAG: M23 family metallopeptidase [Acetobacteraceae bacterium]
MPSNLVAIAAAVAASLALSFGPAAAQPRLRTSLSPPVSPACVSSAFGPRVLANQPAAGTYHSGIDLPAAEGTPVYAAAAGTVMRVQNRGPGGLEMLVQHDGFVGIYSHFSAVMPEFMAGNRTVAAGEQLGFVGSTGVSSGPHLYFGMLLDGRPVDPVPYLRVPPCGGANQPVTTLAQGRTHPLPPRQYNDEDGTSVGQRRYYQVFLPDRQYYQWNRN